MNKEKDKELPLHRKLFNEPVPPKQNETDEEELKIEKDLEEEKHKIIAVMGDYSNKIKENKRNGIIIFGLTALLNTIFDMAGISVMYNYMEHGRAVEVEQYVVFVLMAIFATFKLGAVGVNILAWYYYKKLKDDKKEASNRLWKEYYEKEKVLKSQKNS